MKWIIASLALCFWSSLTSAQSDYIVLTKGDTLKGDVKFLTYEKLDRVQISEGGKKKTYTALEARVVYDQGATYHTVQNDVGIVYMKLLKSGFLSLYEFGKRLDGNTEVRYLIKKDGSMIEMPNLTFKKSMMDFLEDCESVKGEIKSGRLQKKNIEIIIDQYNDCIAKKPREMVPLKMEENESTKLIQDLMAQVEASADFANKKDALDLLKDIKAKASRNEAVPNYLKEGLKSYLGPQQNFKEGLDKLLSALK